MNNVKAIHEELSLDLAYQYSVENYDVFNMQIVLRAYGYPCGFTTALDQVDFARGVK